MIPDTGPVPPREVASLCGAEQRFVAILRLWQTGEGGRAALWSRMSDEMGAARAGSCLSAFQDVAEHLAVRGWRAPTINPPDAPRLTRDEDDLCRLVTAAAEGAREEALELALFLVRPEALLPLVHAASRVGLPLLCAECRARLLARPGTLH